MGHKVHPTIFRIGVIYSHNSKWFSVKNYAKLLEEDVKVRDFLKNKLKEAGLSRVKIERSANAINILIYSSRPGVVIGRGGVGIEDLKKEIKKLFVNNKNNKLEINLNIKEVEKPDLDAQIVLNGIISSLEKRIPFRKVAKRALIQVRQAGAEGVKVIVKGRLDGSEIARTETFSEGKIPLHTLRAKIDYAQGGAHTTYGVVGAKVWIYTGEVFKEKKSKK